MPWVKNLKTGLTHEVPIGHFSLTRPLEYEEVIQPSPIPPGESGKPDPQGQALASASVKEVESSQLPITASSPPPSRGRRSAAARRTTP